MRQMQELREENARLRAQVVRLQQTIVDMLDDHWFESRGQMVLHIQKRLSSAIDWGDLDPEPHGAASETESPHER